MGARRFFRFFGHINPMTIRRTVEAIGRQRLPGLAAEMAYNAMLGLFPAILTVLTAIGLFHPLNVAFQQLAERIREVAPVEVFVLIDRFVRDISDSRDGGLFSLSFVVALWATSGAFSAAMTALDQIHRIPMKRRRPFWKAKLISLGLTLGTILLLMIASALVLVGDWAISYLDNTSDFFSTESLARLLTWGLSLGIVSIAFGLVYRIGPSRWTSNKPIFPGAILAAISWATISSLFRSYVSNFGDYNRAYGAIGTVIVLLLWLYLSSLVLLIGDQLNVTVGEDMAARSAKLRSSKSPHSSQSLNHPIHPTNHPSRDRQ
ncbi:MAG: YihY/virulence factor BrkB family protein [Leptolyngbyaceae cyanobacterium SL_7_1]|nr:YihY/virulence factor BrkB family protein [Leptolyngbyaceae cyanobacterium SL_7_1]